MKTVKEVSRMTGVSVRTLQYYDRIGLLPPAGRTEAGYRLYDGRALETLQQILLFRELEFPLREIREILQSPGFDRGRALEQQIALLELKRQRLDRLIALARAIRLTGGKTMEFDAFDTSRLEALREQARKQWGSTPQFEEFQERTQGRSGEEEQAAAAGLMEVFREFGALRGEAPDSPRAQRQVERLREYISAHFYACDGAMLARLGELYEEESFAASIDQAGGPGTAAFVREAIRRR